MKNKKYVPMAVMAGVVGILLLASFPPKWFAAVEMIQLAADKDWLHKATKEISKHWRANVNGIRILSLCPKRSHSKLHKNAELLWRRTKNAVAATASNPNTEGSGASWNASPKATGDSP